MGIVLASDATAPKRRGPRPIAARDWLFGYAPRRQLLTCLYGPGAPPKGIRENGLAARRVGRRDRYFPCSDSDSPAPSAS